MDGCSSLQLPMKNVPMAKVKGSPMPSMPINWRSSKNDITASACCWSLRFLWELIFLVLVVNAKQNMEKAGGVAGYFNGIIKRVTIPAMNRKLLGSSEKGKRMRLLSHALLMQCWCCGVSCKFLYKLLRKPKEL